MKIQTEQITKVGRNPILYPPTLPMARIIDNKILLESVDDGVITNQIIILDSKDIRNLMKWQMAQDEYEEKGRKEQYPNVYCNKNHSHTKRCLQ